MNIFEEYLKKINTLVDKNKEILKLDNLNNFKGIVVEIPPEDFNFDLSCNASLVLAKINKINPKELANKIKDLILKNLSDFEKIDIAGPGFLNLKLTNKSLISNKPHGSWTYFPLVALLTVEISISSSLATSFKIIGISSSFSSLNIECCFFTITFIISSMVRFL